MVLYPKPEMDVNTTFTYLKSNKANIKAGNPGQILPGDDRWVVITYLDHDEASFAKSRTLHRESCGCPGISTREIILIVSHHEAKIFRSESLEKYSL